MDDYFYDWHYFGFNPLTPRFLILFPQSTLYVKYTTIFPIYQKITLKKILGLLIKSEKSTFCAGNRIRTYNWTVSKAVVYTISTIRAILAVCSIFFYTTLPPSNTYQTSSIFSNNFSNPNNPIYFFVSFKFIYFHAESVRFELTDL